MWHQVAQQDHACDVASSNDSLLADSRFCNSDIGTSPNRLSDFDTNRSINNLLTLNPPVDQFQMSLDHPQSFEFLKHSIRHITHVTIFPLKELFKCNQV